jgi:hypothetical protein
MSAAILVLDSANVKLGSGVAATYASIEVTCPTTCALRNRGCYAQYGKVALTATRLDASTRAAPVGPWHVASEEAAAIDAIATPEGRPLRLQVSGDARSPEAAATLAGAAWGWLARGGGPVWGYTHAWRDVLRDVWGRVSILASVDHTSQGCAALERGYAPAAITGPHPADGRAYTRHGVTWIPCPQQTRGRTCVECRLCWNGTGLAIRSAGIAFSAHGSQSRKALQVFLPIVE